MATDWDSQVERLRRQTAGLQPTPEQLARWSAAARRPAPSPFLAQLARTGRWAALASGLAAALLLAFTWGQAREARRESLALLEAGWTP